MGEIAEHSLQCQIGKRHFLFKQAHFPCYPFGNERFNVDDCTDSAAEVPSDVHYRICSGSNEFY